MAVTVGTGKGYHLASRRPTASPFTCCYWLRLTGSAANTSFIYNTTGFGQYIEIGSLGTTQLEMWTSGADASGPTLTSGVWYGVACTYDGTTAKMYTTGAQGAAPLTIATAAVTFNSTVDEFYWLNDSADEFTTGDGENFKAWQAVLTSTEIYKELMSYKPVRGQNLLMWTPADNALTAKFDMSNAGLQRNWTVDGAPTTGPFPSPINWFKRNSIWTMLAPLGGGGTTYFQTASVTVNAAVSRAIQAGLIRAPSAVSRTTSLSKQIGAIRSVTVSASDTLAKAISTARSLTVSQSSLAPKQVNLIKAPSTVTETSSLTKQPGLVRSVTVAAPVDTISRAVSAIRAVTVSGSRTALKFVNLLSTGTPATVAVSGTITKQPQLPKSVTASAPVTGVSRLVGAIRSVTVAATDTVTKAIARTVAAVTVSETSSRVLQVGKPIAPAVVTETSTLGKLVGAIRAVTVSESASRTAAISTTKSKTVSQSSAVPKQVNLIRGPSAVAVTAAMTKIITSTIFQTASVTVSQVSSVAKQVAKSLSSTVNASETVSRAVSASKSVSVTTAPTVTRAVARTDSKTVSAAASLVKQVGLPRAVVIASAVSVARQTGKLASVLASVSADIRKSIGHTAGVTVSASPAVIAGRAYGVVISKIVSVLTSVAALFIQGANIPGSVTGTITPRDSATGAITPRDSAAGTVTRRDTANSSIYLVP